MYSEYYSDVDTYLDDMENMAADPEEFLYENATDEIVGQQGLQEFLDSWCKKHQNYFHIMKEGK